MVELGRMWMTEPSVILVDEPTAGLAKVGTSDVNHLLADLGDHDGITIVLEVREIRKALRMADCIWGLEPGRIEVLG